ncbi:DUF2510 domain-containing protein [Mycolicibacterium sp. J2]|uniref:DUF2510 domain-containing protein n=1 Tax=Mycolicibacterium sp. J2 TaxID=2993511 RepID=UPI00224B3BD0|nr:DUF2510 domain-containing protein [Mycolicibacterium sp. J2]MCX2715961.1 DUF2510 domain-containing protein [Mycolicibacterium sp. J2]
MAEHPERATDSTSWDDPGDPHYFARTIAASAAKRDKIIEDVARSAGPHDDIDYLTKRELYRAGLISASELHATGSPELLPAGWYTYYVDAINEHCPTRVFSREEAGQDAADLYERGYRWIAVFSQNTGPRGDRTFLDVRSFAAAAMTENGQTAEEEALEEIAAMGLNPDDLPKDVFMPPRREATAPIPLTLPPGAPLPGWYPDPAQRFHYRWWDGQRWTHTTATSGRTYTDPI